MIKLKRSLVKTLNKRNVTLLIFILCVITFVSIYFLKTNYAVTYYVDGIKTNKATIEYEYGDELLIQPSDLNLVATKKDKVYELDYDIPHINQIKTYTVKYRVKNKRCLPFVLKIKVVDTTAPSITGKMNYTVDKGETFGIDQLKLNVTDNYDQDLTNNITMDLVDTNQEGSRDVSVCVKDSSNNQTCTTIHVSIGVDPEDIAVMLNKNRSIPNEWEPSDLVEINSNNEGKHRLRKQAAMQWEKMRSDALKDGIVIKVVSSYRSKEYQTNLFNSYMATDPANASTYSAYPRTSEHELGLTVDISYDWELHHDLQDSNLGKWMNQHSYEYGWILRYPKDKTSITGYIYEPWHYRYVGPELAKVLYENDLTMEEYLG